MKHAKPKTGWAVVDRSGINIRTVSDTRRAALVNWLCVEKGVLTLDFATDDQIEQLWAAKAGAANCTTVEISLSSPHKTAERQP